MSPGSNVCFRSIFEVDPSPLVNTVVERTDESRKARRRRWSAENVCVTYVLRPYKHSGEVIVYVVDILPIEMRHVGAVSDIRMRKESPTHVRASDSGTFIGR